MAFVSGEEVKFFFFFLDRRRIPEDTEKGTKKSDKLLLQASGWRRVAAGGGQAEKNVDRMAHATSLLSSGISRRNPEDEYELIHKIGSGTYGDVYKVRTEGGGGGFFLSSRVFVWGGFLEVVASASVRGLFWVVPGADNFRSNINIAVLSA